MDKLIDFVDNRLTDKNTRHSYIETYEKFFQPIRSSVKTILEIGVQAGGGIKMLHGFFENSRVTGVDINYRFDVSFLKNLERVNLLLGDAYNTDFINSNFNSHKFDILIDDGPHTFDSQLFFLNNYSKLVKENGLVIVEDVLGIEGANRLIKENTSNLEYEIIDLRHERKLRNQDNILIIGKNK